MKTRLLLAIVSITLVEALSAGAQTATGQGATALGSSGTASGAYSLSINGTAAGFGSFAAGGGQTSAAATWSMALGDSASAIGEESAAVGEFATAYGAGSFAGVYGYAIGDGSVAFGGVTRGFLSVAFGWYSFAHSRSCLVIGEYNVGSYFNNNNGNPNDDGDTQWIPTDPIFEIGNGSDNNQRSNALTVFKNGSATFQGRVKVAPGGDIPMYTGN